MMTKLRMNTKFLYLLLSLLPLIDCTKHCKNIIKFDGKVYEKEFLADGTVSKPFFMTYLEEKDKILFSEDAEPFGNTNTMLLDVTTKKLHELNINNVVVNGVLKNGTILIGKDGGLFHLDEATMKLTETALKDIIFYSMYTKGDKIYYTDYPKKDLYVHENGETKLLMQDLHISDLTLDADDNLYYFNKTGIFVKASNVIREIKALAYDEVPLNGLIFDERRNVVYATSVYGVFKVDIKKMALNRISIKTMFDIVFDKSGSMIYADEESIVRLKLTDAIC